MHCQHAVQLTMIAQAAHKVRTDPGTQVGTNVRVFDTDASLIGSRVHNPPLYFASLIE